MIVCVVAPLLHKYDPAVGTVNPTEPPSQIFVGPFAVITAIGTGVNATVETAEVTVQPFVPVKVTE